MKLISCDRNYAPQILAIMNQVIAVSTALYDYNPRSIESMDSWFNVKERARYPVIGAVDDNGRLLGFGSYGQFRAWPAYKYTIEHSVYVAENARRKGIGSLLLDALVDQARAQQYHNIVGGIDADNYPSQALHRKCGFLLCGRIRHAGYKFGRWLDLDFYQRLLDTPDDPKDG
jgi:L-amino acid N-acyltransferase